MRRETRGGVEALGGVRALLLPELDLSGASVSSSCFPEMLTGGLTQGLCRIIQNPGAIATDRDLNVILLNELADLLGMELLEL